MKKGHVIFFQDRLFPEKKAPAAELRNHLGFHKEPIRSEGTGKVTSQVPNTQVPNTQVPTVGGT